MFTREATGLVREIGPWSALYVSWNAYSVAIGTVLIFLISLYLYPGAEMVSSIIIGFILIAILSLIYYVFMSAMPRSGGEYVFISRAVNPVLGFTINWAYTISFMLYFGPLMSFVYVPLVISPSLTFMGLVTNTGWLTNFGGWIVTPTGLFAFCAVFYVLIALALSFGLRPTVRISGILFWLSTAAMVIMIITFATTPNSVWIDKVNSFILTYTGKPDFYKFVISSASTSGLTVPPYNLTDTFGSLIISYVTYQGVWFTAYYAGELKRSNRSLMSGMIGAGALGMAQLAIVAALAIPMLGRNFIVSLAYLFYSNPSVLAPYLPSGLVPSTPFYALVLNSNPIIQWIIALGFIVAAWSSILGIWLPLSRNVFAWSFDRVVPTAFAYVDSRFHSPLGTNLLILAAAEVGLALTIFTPLFGWINQLLFAFIVLAVIGVVAIIFPFTKKEIYEKTALRHSIGGIPLVTILGIILAVFSVYGEYVSATNSFISGPLTLQTWGIVFFTFALGPIIYYAARAYHKRHGIDIGMIFKQIPPD